MGASHRSRQSAGHQRPPGDLPQPPRLVLWNDRAARGRRLPGDHPAGHGLRPMVSPGCPRHRAARPGCGWVTGRHGGARDRASAPARGRTRHADRRASGHRQPGGGLEPHPAPGAGARSRPRPRAGSPTGHDDVSVRGRFRHAQRDRLIPRTPGRQVAPALSCRFVCRPDRCDERA